MNITVVKHKAGVTTKLPGACYIGRMAAVRKQYLLSVPHLANPHRLGRDGNRQQVVHKFRDTLWEQINTGGPELVELLDILDRAKVGSVVLVCHCAPLACHGDVIKAAVEWLDSVTEEPATKMAVEELGAEITGVS